MRISLLDSVPHGKMWEFLTLEDWLPTIGIIRGRALVVSGVIGVLNCSYVTWDTVPQAPSPNPESVGGVGGMAACKAKNKTRGLP